MNDWRFELDGAAVDAETFRRVAIDPAQSVAVDACAGSGKTTLLVTRIVRALLEGAQPDQILAITFTRLAAHEMRERLTATLRRLVWIDDAALQLELTQWFGLTLERAQALAPRARDLYELVLCDPRGVDITTFHRWFKVIGASAPLQHAASAGAELAENTAELEHQAWFVWLDHVRAPDWQARRDELEALIAERGLSETRRALRSLLANRTPWAVALGIDPGADLASLRAAGERAADAYAQTWCAAMGDALQGMGAEPAAVAAVALAPGQPVTPTVLEAAQAALVAGVAQTPSWQAALQRCIRVLAQGTAATIKQAQALEAALTAIHSLDVASATSWMAWFDQLSRLLLTNEHKPRVWRSSKALDAAIAQAAGPEPVNLTWQAVALQIRQVRRLLNEARDVLINARFMRCGADLLWVFRELKRARGLMDFADLESMAFDTLRDPGVAAYVQCRMDRRYRHLMFDEFQDTSSLQWRVIADWLASYAGAGERPSVFVVGDPKQSIYRFRGAEARVFDAAKALLCSVFEARLAATDTTRRNAPAIVDVLNACLPAAMPHYRLQATAAGGPGLVWRLPLVAADEVAGPESVDAIDESADESDGEYERGYCEGLAIAEAITAARAELAAQGKPVSWGSIFILARSRSVFEGYERALRERGLPVRSDRSGGLLRALEVDDLRALLSFVRRPADDLALVQIMASPLLGVDQASLAAWMTQCAAPPDGAKTPGGRSLWARCQALAARSPEWPVAGRPVAEWVALLASWIDRAARVPPHDFLDGVLAEQDAWARYAAAVPPAQRGLVLANLHQLLGHALDFDAGRCPSLARYLASLRGFAVLDERESPSEGRSDTVDAIRLMTIHASKGLEADLVVLAGAHAPLPSDRSRLFVDWAPEWLRPEHVSFVSGAAAGVAREDRFTREAALREREDRNLLYVALTRARHGLIVSGVQRKQALVNSWYSVLSTVPEPPAWPRSTPVESAAATHPEVFTLRTLATPPLAVGTYASGRAAPMVEGDLDEAAGAAWATELGHALHRALELGSEGHERATIARALQAFALDAPKRHAAMAQAEAVLQLPALAPAFAPDAPAANEFEIMDAAGQLRRIDRLVQVGATLWIIDYKWSVDAAARPGYAAQLAEYRRLIAGLAQPPWGPVQAIRTVLVDAKARQVAFDVDGDGAA